ncbi:inositol monophosphatase family protein [Rhizobium rhizoryzae]|uniref:inositol monophosphatase family protein n=1 Tax=Rhizobium rhizoryzae TaxID=451876 RepID=UPI00289DA903|nr:inositol monophosphatase [Rhizobium rhizoryzae]
MSSTTLDERENALHGIIRDAGLLALDCYRKRRAGEFSLKGRQDFLTEADGLVEARVFAQLKARFPEDSLLGEETGGGSGGSRLWVVDPIDGTANFARGIDHFCVAIAYVEDGQTELAATYNPVTGELYTARRGRGAAKNGVPLRVAATSTLETASIELGWSHHTPEGEYISLFTAVFSGGASVRRGASGALALAWVAEGRTDGYVEYFMNAWDCLGGLLMVREAGGCTGTFPVTSADLVMGGPVLAAAPGVAGHLAEVTGLPLMTRENST